MKVRIKCLHNKIIHGAAGKNYMYYTIINGKSAKQN